jgi:hypothetical protein
MSFWKQRPSKVNFVVYGLAWICVITWLLKWMLFQRCFPVHWAEFAYGFMTVFSFALAGTVVEFLHWWIRWVNFKQPLRSQNWSTNQILKPTVPFDVLGATLGLVERVVFTTLAVMLTLASESNNGLGTQAVVLASIAAGWIGLKTIMGYRRLTAQDVTILRLSTASIVGSLLSVFLSVLAGILALKWFPPT